MTDRRKGPEDDKQGPEAPPLTPIRPETPAWKCEGCGRPHLYAIKCAWCGTPRHSYLRRRKVA